MKIQLTTYLPPCCCWQPCLAAAKRTIPPQVKFEDYNLYWVEYGIPSLITFDATINKMYVINSIVFGVLEYPYYIDKDTLKSNGFVITLDRKNNTLYSLPESDKIILKPKAIGFEDVLYKENIHVKTDIDSPHGTMHAANIYL